jgi:hypothetical protein
LRRAAELASRVEPVKDSLTLAIHALDDVLPRLAVMRNVGEHIDDYAVDSPGRRPKDVFSAAENNKANHFEKEDFCAINLHSTLRYPG